jgi:hypothetical protein
MSQPLQIDRRSFLALGGAAMAAGLVSPLPASEATGARAAGMMAPQDFKRKLDGPVMSIPTCFTSGFAVDFDGVQIGRAHV